MKGLRDARTTYLERHYQKIFCCNHPLQEVPRGNEVCMRYRQTNSSLPKTYTPTTISSSTHDWDMLRLARFSESVVELFRMASLEDKISLSVLAEPSHSLLLLLSLLLELLLLLLGTSALSDFPNSDLVSSPELSCEVSKPASASEVENRRLICSVMRWVVEARPRSRTFSMSPWKLLSWKKLVPINLSMYLGTHICSNTKQKTNKLQETLA